MVRTRGPPLRKRQPRGAWFHRTIAGALRSSSSASRSRRPVSARDGRPGAVRHPGLRRRDRDAASVWETLMPPPPCLPEFEELEPSERTRSGRLPRPRDAARCCSRRMAMPRPLRSRSSAPSRSIVESRSRSSSPARCCEGRWSSGGRSRSRPRAADPSAVARDLRGAWRAALGRQGSCRARPYRRQGARRRRVDADRGTDRPARRGGQDEQGSRGDPRGGRADRRVRPDPDLSQARRPIAHGACPQTPRTSLSKVRGFPRYEAGSLDAMVVACRVTWSSATGRDRIPTVCLRWPTGLLPAPDT